MAVIFWVEDQSHWINKFSSVLESTHFDQIPDAQSSSISQSNSRSTSQSHPQPNTLIVSRFAEAAKQRIAQLPKDQPPHIAILDARMNGNDQAGFSVSQALNKKWPQLPIIYLSEYSGTQIEADAFEQASTQDFIAKHQRNVEAVLCWRIKAILRQQNMGNEIATTSSSEEAIISGPLTIDLITWDVYWRKIKLMNPANPKRPLAPMPRKILRYLVECSPRPITTLQMAECLDADPERFSYANYRQHIKTLRHAFEFAEGKQGHFISHCKNGQAIATFGDQGAYCWIPPNE
ncbi:DNA-binding response regulator [Marinibactrum halimedae]|uniref:Response regulatory domain-containing protein n=1 Tax=Marinibactrum halimedae TaxID=1444977 RepID=A0AA37WMQ7_9GAMM|nr:DNA-binding response regulator [Marinibactrum halimedae]MCD9460888.1 DNA-binding response regulator [Marinibactrum halimedae]GLS27334.1 hypothetical protein GCM10007877_30530 [Marinibactrum halimedae]